MPVRLKNGVMIYNVTPHDLRFEDEEGNIETVPSDDVIDATPFVSLVKQHKEYSLNTVVFHAKMEGYRKIDAIKILYPDALIVGSLIAAQAYPGDVAAPVPVQGGRPYRSERGRNLRPDRFTIFPLKENSDG